MSNKFTARIQSEFNSYYQRLSNYISKPEMRFIQEACHGILCSQSVTITKMATHIHDKIKSKKTQERFRRHYNKDGFWLKLIKGHIQSVKNVFHHGDYLLFDLSDIQKKYSKSMEGLEYVYDGSTKETGLGYWLANIIGIRRDGSQLMPLYSKLYSFAKEAISENTEIKSAIDLVSKYIQKKVIWVIDRGGDRQILIDHFITTDRYFIIRLMGKGKLQYLGKVKPFKKISHRVRLHYTITVEKIKKNRITYAQYDIGAVKVNYVHRQTGKVYSDKQLWLVVAKGHGKGYSWYLVSSDKDTSRQVCEECFNGYGFRWKIEEYHRHVKDQYDLEGIQVLKFNGLQSMMSVVTIAMYLLYSQTRDLHDKLIMNSEIKVLEKYQIREVIGFVYYKITTIFKFLLTGACVRKFAPNYNHNRDNPHQVVIFAN